MYQQGDGGAFAVDSGQLSQHGADVAMIAGQIHDSMGAMRVKLESLQGTWKGAAAGQYVQLHHEWEVAQERVRATLEDISVALGRASGAYAAVEHEVMATFTP
ncbi:WXG100 family type VII secretion target [Allobranchiibius sp. CTAmp26]|uniref:WXG100 family type VII secretion target n=1 Tax=Allobranchiibius sp. CTAmp26 TaxID=2815214 RepID=UPI001AA10BE2|nr:WXG100 family type VII secretion target [Allobranchiibius sp. CTAmp26]MBO1753588.1 WXG100 family type VII secretion target [Allobranchiibius sp. CTAmp26]